MPSVYCNETEKRGAEGIERSRGDRGLTVWGNGLGCNLPGRRCEIAATHRGLMVSLEPTKAHPDGFHYLATETTNPWAAYELARAARTTSAREIREGDEVRAYCPDLRRWVGGWTVQRIDGDTLHLDRRTEYMHNGKYRTSTCETLGTITTGFARDLVKKVHRST